MKTHLLPLLFLANFATAQPAAVAEKNTATIPVGKLENDFYDWNQRHAEILAIKDSVKPEIILIGDSITHLWGGPPNEPNGNRGAVAWKDLFGEKPVLNLGFGWDRTQNVLFRIQQGELDGLTPKFIVIHIGTNNLARSTNAPNNTPAEIVEGITQVVENAHQKCPNAKIILMAVFPRDRTPQEANRQNIIQINQLLAVKFTPPPAPYLTYLDITKDLLDPDDTISKEVMGDYLHPTAKGYTIWANALKPHLK